MGKRLGPISWLARLNRFEEHRHEEKRGSEGAEGSGASACETAPRGHGRLTDTTQEKLTTRRSSSLWRPLRVSTLRNLLLADVVADVGAFMQNVGAAWLMVSLGADAAARD